MVRLDLYYVENWSLSFDVKIIPKTLSAVLTAICSAVEPQYIDMLAITQKVFSVRVMH